ncbi:hypothetical protein EE36_00145, partial [Sulfitobacter sp. EE-36]
ALIFHRSCNRRQMAIIGRIYAQSMNIRSVLGLHEPEGKMNAIDTGQS